MVRIVMWRAMRWQRLNRRWRLRTGVAQFWLVLAVALGATGCGYHFIRYEGTLGDNQSLAIRTPSNESYDPGVEFIVADALRREGLRRGGLILVENPDNADVLLSGRVLPIQTVGRSVSSVVLVLEYEITLSLDLQIQLRDGRAIPLDRLALRETERYLASANAEVTRKNREEALRFMASTIANRVYDNLYAGLSQ